MVPDLARIQPFDWLVIWNWHTTPSVVKFCTPEKESDLPHDVGRSDTRDSILLATSPRSGLRHVSDHVSDRFQIRPYFDLKRWEGLIFNLSRKSSRAHSLAPITVFGSLRIHVSS